MNISNEIELDQAIQLLEIKQEAEMNALKLKAQEFTNQLNPISMITQTFEEISSYPDLKNNLVSFAKEKVAGFVLEKYMGLRSKNKMMNVLGSVLRFTIEQFVLKGR